ncbi:Multidrug resistance-associated protein 1 [Bulinus truncatus]|nr:Multidrug resistance-associated protein 1 [Bulinus truncatus]
MNQQSFNFSSEILNGFCDDPIWILALVFEIVERRKRFVTSGVLFIFWLLLITTNIVHFYTYIETEQPSPELSASFLSRITFWWLEKFMRQGYKEPLTESRLFDLHPRDKCQTVIQRFLNYWLPALSAAKRKSKKRAAHQTEISERTPLVTASVITEETPPSKKKSSGLLLLYVLFVKTFWADLFISQIWKLFYDILLLTNPLLLGALVNFVQSQSSEIWHGYVLAAALFVSTSLQTFFFHQLFHYSTSLALRVRASVISSVFRKSLTMDNKARKESTIGEVVNLMSVDASNLETAMSYLWAIWSSPLQISVTLYLLYNMIGVSMFAGAAFLVLLIPANGVITSRMGKYQTQLMEFKDKRLKTMNEMLTGIKIVKLFAWEKSFEKKILDVRNSELENLKNTALIRAVTSLSWGVAPYITSSKMYTPC